MTPEELRDAIKTSPEQYRLKETMLCPCKRGRRLSQVFIGPGGVTLVMVADARAYRIDGPPAKDLAKCRRCGRGMQMFINDGRVDYVELDPPTQGVIA